MDPQIQGLTAEQRLFALVVVSIAVHLLLLSRMSPPTPGHERASVPELSVILQPVDDARTRAAHTRLERAPSHVSTGAHVDSAAAQPLRLNLPLAPWRPHDSEKKAFGPMRPEPDAPIDGSANAGDGVRAAIGRAFGRVLPEIETARLDNGQILVRYARAGGGARCFFVREANPLNSFDNGTVASDAC